MFAGRNEMVGRGFIANSDGHMTIEPGFDAYYYERAKKDKPRKNKNYQQHLKLDVDSKLHFDVTVPVKMNMDAAPMAEIKLSGEVARAFINAPIEDREGVIEEFFGGHDWRDMVDEVIMTATEKQAVKFAKRIDEFRKVGWLAGHFPKLEEDADGWWWVWSDRNWFHIDRDGDTYWQTGEGCGDFDLYWEDGWNEFILSKLVWNVELW